MSAPTPPTTAPFPTNWLIGQDYNPNEHLIQLERFDKRTNRKITSDYLNVQGRVMWFIRDQRALTVAGLAKVPYVIKTELVEIDREQGWAQFKTYVRDVLGNEATMYGSESVKDFGDYAEKASTKGLGRALMMLGYFVGFAAELDEGDRIVDAPQDQTPQSNTAPVLRQQMQAAATTPPTPTPTPRPQPQPNTTQSAPDAQTQTRTATPTATTPAMVTDRQKESMTKLCIALKRPVPAFADMTFDDARTQMTQLSNAYAESRSAS